MLCLKESEFLSTGTYKKTKRSFKDRYEYFRLRRLKKWMFCPACKSGKMSFTKKKSHWICEDCGYSFSEEYFLDNCIFWFCDECGSFLNNQEGFDRNEPKHICSECGFENDTTENNIKGECVDCGKLLSDPDAHLCISCHQTRKEKAKKRILVAGAVVAGTAAVAGAAVLAVKSAVDGDDYTSLSGDDDNDFALEETYPHCKTCGAEMTNFDGWAWYTCPECEDKVRIIDGKETWYNEIFANDKKEHKSDFELADFCRGGDLTED